MPFQDPLELKQQLGTLIELTKEGLLEQRRAELLEEVGQLELEAGEGEAGASSKEEPETSLEEDFSQLVGLRVSAPLSSIPPRSMELPLPYPPLGFFRETKIVSQATSLGR